LNRNICKSFCTISFCKFYKLINLFTRHCTLFFGIDSADASALLQSSGKDAESAVLYDLADIDKLHSETGVRLVGTVAVHCILPCHSLDRKLYIHIQNFFKQISKETLVDFQNIIYINKGKLHVDLCKFRLAVCTEIFVPVASCKLEIAVASGAHQQLL